MGYQQKSPVVSNTANVQKYVDSCLANKTSITAGEVWNLAYHQSPSNRGLYYNKHKNNAYVGVSKLNYFSTSLKKKIAKAESGHLSVINVYTSFGFIELIHKSKSLAISG